MKIRTTVTEIECNAEELRQSNSVSDALTGALRRAFGGPIFSGFNGIDEEEEEEEEEAKDGNN